MVKLSPLMKMGSRVFSFCKGSKSNQRRRRSTISLTSFGITETTLRVTRSLNVGACSNASLKPRAGIQLGSYVEDEGKALFNLTKEKGMEGIIAKRKDSIYRPGKRTSDWLKIKARLQQEFVVGGFTAPKGSRKHLGAVVLGAYTNGELRHYGYAGSGFSEKGLKDAVEKMKPLLTEKCPFVNPPNIKEKIQWVRPKLVCEVEYAELTADDQLRQTTFLGWRDDKKAKEVVLEQSQIA